MTARTAASALLMFVALYGSAAAEPYTLRFTPEEGLRIPYEIEAKGVQILRALGQTPVETSFSFSARRLDVFTNTDRDDMTLKRTFSQVRYWENDERVSLPSGVEGGTLEYTVDALGHVVPDEDSSFPEATPFIIGDILNVVETIPFGEKAVKIGDTWDASSPNEDDSKAKMIEKRSIGELVGLYESGGMEVALIQQHARFVYELEGTEERPPLRVTLVAEILQSNRIEDGALLGIRGNLHERIEFLRPDGQVAMVLEIPEIQATLQVAEE